MGRSAASPLFWCINTQMNYIEFLDFPTVPEELLDPISSILDRPKIPSALRPTGGIWFQSKRINSTLCTWLTSVFPFEFVAQYQIIKCGLPIHRDKGRNLAYNYLLQHGGTNVVTSVYDNSRKILQCEIIPLKKWHKIEIHNLHGISGLDTEGARIALSITPLSVINPVKN